MKHQSKMRPDGSARLRPLTWQSVLSWVALTTLAYLGNVGRLPLFFNVDFLFGSVFVFVVLHYYGWLPALVTGVVAASHTAFLWQHSYAIVIFSLEALLIGLFYRRRSDNLMLLSLVYWLFVGMPLVLLFYGGVMQMAFGSTGLVALKQAINGIVNALIASLLITIAQQARPSLDRPLRRAPFAFAQVIFLLMAAFVLIPGMVILVATARQEMGRVESDVQAKLEMTSFSMRQALNAWITENLQTLSSLVSYTVIGGAGDLARLRHEMALLKMSNADFTAIAILDPAGRLVIGEPHGAARLMLQVTDVAQWPYLSRMSAGPGGVASDVIARSDGNPIVVLGVPIVERDQLAGAVIGMLDTGRLREVLYRLAGSWSVEATIVDGRGRAIASTSPKVEPFADFRNRLPSADQHYRGNLFLRSPRLERNVSIMQRWQESEYLTLDRLGQHSAWSLVLEAPIAPYQDALNARYQSMLLLMLVIIVGTILLSAAVSRRMLSSLTQLTVVTENLPDKVTRQDGIDWPHSTINEIDTLISCFRVTADHLGESFGQIQEANRQLMAAKQEAEAASRTKTEFLANISHDLRTPLNGILGYAQILARDTTLDERTAEAVAIIEKSGLHLLNLINDILDVSRIEAGKLLLTPEPFRLPGFLRDIAAMVAIQARRKGLEFESRFGDDLPPVVVGDEKRLRQVVLNLLNNAVKFTERGTIRFRVTRAESRLRFEVEDTGIGIPAEALEEIFSPFKQLARHVQSEEGTGLGLAIVKRLVETMGGRVRVESAPGAGSRFSFDVSLPESPVAPAAAHPVGVVTGYDGPERTVLVVDDKRENRSVLRTMLEPLGFEILEAANGAEGVDLARQAQPDLVLMDLVMPVLDGFEAIRVLRSDPATAEVLVIAVSASVASSIREECVRLGFNEFLPKPFRQFDLLQAIERVAGVAWVYRSEPATAEPEEEATCACPVADELDELLAHVGTGNIRSIIGAAEALKERDPACAPFADRVIRLAHEFQINRLADFLAAARRDSVGDEVRIE